MMRKPGVTCWAHIMPMRVTPRQASGQVTASVLTTVIWLAEMPSLAARAAMAACCAGDRPEGEAATVTTGVGVTSETTWPAGVVQATNIKPRDVRANNERFMTLHSPLQRYRRNR